MSYKRKGQSTVSGGWARHLRPWHRREFAKAERRAQKLFTFSEEHTATPVPPNTSMKLLSVFTTVASRDEARKIAGALVERSLVACAQISEIESFYRWRGAVQHEPEYRLMLKTTETQYQAVEAAIRELHSYELPAIHAVAIEQVYGPYAAWVEEGSSGEA